MAKALIYEMRKASLVNNESFNFRTSDSDDLRLKEQYLSSTFDY